MYAQIQHTGWPSDQHKNLTTKGELKMQSLKEIGPAPEASFDFVCRDIFGIQKWKETIHNTVCLPGKENVLNVYFGAATQTTTWYTLLVGGAATIANTDTLASHAGWTEVTAYSGNRPSITWSAATLVSTTAEITSSAGVTFTMNASYTVNGAGLCTVATGTSGILYDAALFGSARSGASGDTITVTPTLSVA